MAEKLPVAASPEKIQWYWESNTFEFRPYDAEANGQIEAAYTAKKDGVMVVSKSRSYELDFASMIQRNVKSKLCRQIRRINDVPLDGTHVWNYQQGKDNLTMATYSDKDSEALERAYLSHCPSWNVIIKGRLYVVDFKRMTQRNITTKFERKISRVLTESAAETTVVLCKICCKFPQSVIFLPCGHLGCCGNCAKGLKSGKCPFCNVPYEKVQDVYQP